MKKTLIALLLAAMMLCQITAATAGEFLGAGTSQYLSGSSGMTVADFLATPENRAYATWYGVLEFCSLFGRSYSDLDMTQDTFVRSTTMGELHILLPAANLTGYFDLCWSEKTGTVTLSFDHTSTASLRYDADTFLNDDWSDMTSASDDVAAIYDYEWK